MQVPILNGIYTDEASDFRTSYPRNLVPVPKANGISAGYLRPADGIILEGTGPGIDRGAVAWNGICYRVMGTKLISINSDGVYTILGDVGGAGHVSFAYSFDRLAISSSGKLYYWDGSSLSQVIDPDLGVCIDVVWVDGYFMTTDGTSLIVTELSDPTSVNPLKYGSAEADPDDIKCIRKLRNEIYAVNRHTVEVFNNIGGTLFPFQRVEGAQLMRGAIGTYSAAVFMEALAFVGSGVNESIAVWIGQNGTTAKLSTREIEKILSQYSEGVLSQIVVESRVVDSHQFLYIHLPDKTLLYDGVASQELGEPVWAILDSGILSSTTYRARNFVFCYGKWLCSDPTTTNYGRLTNAISSHYGSEIGWEFDTAIIYNEGRGAILHQVELVCLTGRASFTDNPTIWTSYSIDGETWSTESPRTVGRQGQRNKRIAWLQQGFMRNWRIQKFRSTSKAHVAMARLEVNVEPMNV